jgi:hypothetical protein
MSHLPPVRRRRSATIIYATAALILGTTAFLSRPDQEHAPNVNVVRVVATDYAFQAPDSIPAGRTEIRLVNKGPELHHVSLFRLTNGKRLADLLEALKVPGPLPAWATDVGGPNAPAPGSESNATLTLEPGRYAMLCFIPATDGQLHMRKGMVKEFAVVRPAGAQARPAATRAADAAPRPDVVMTLRDYAFDLSAPITAGTRTIRVRNAGPQAHEVLIARLAPGATAAQLLAFIEKPTGGPPPGAPLGGTTGMATGRENDVTIEFTRGEYAFICFVPDDKDGKPHLAHGMVRQVRVE